MTAKLESATESTLKRFRSSHSLLEEFLAPPKAIKRDGEARAQSPSSVATRETKKGPWSGQEDERLRALVRDLQGGQIKSLLNVKTNAFDWKAVAKKIPGRSVKQVRERWLNFCDPALNMGPWTAEEDARLLVVAKAYNNSWTRIAAVMEGRTTNRVKTRWKALHRIEQRSKPWTPHEDVVIIDGRRKGLSWGKCLRCCLSAARK